MLLRVPHRPSCAQHHDHLQDQESVPPAHFREQRLASICLERCVSLKVDLTVPVGLSRSTAPQLDDRRHPPTRTLRLAATVRFWSSCFGERLLMYSVRYSIVPKLIEEAHAHFGSGSGPQSAKKPTVSMHRGGVYFYLLRLSYGANAVRD